MHNLTEVGQSLNSRSGSMSWTPEGQRSSCATLPRRSASPSEPMKLQAKTLMRNVDEVREAGLPIVVSINEHTPDGTLKNTIAWRFTSIVREAQQSVNFYRRHALRWKRKGEDRKNRTTAAGCYLAARQALHALRAGTT